MLQWNLVYLNKGRIHLFWELNLPRETDPATERKQFKKLRTQTNYTKGIRIILENN